jgi:23S rRNA (guanosine2251-2'-O)-methyltransferase
MSEHEDWVVGIHAVSQVLTKQPNSVQRLLLQSGRDDMRIEKITELAAKAGINEERVDKRQLDKLVAGSHQGVIALCELQNSAKDERFLSQMLDSLEWDPLLLVLDGITDPHNLGACLRTADAAGVDAIIVPKDKSASLNATVRKVASGAAESVNFVVVTNLQRCLEALKERGIWLVGTADEATQSVYEQELTGAVALVMGSEGKGLRRLTRETCDFLVSIPMSGDVSSLNVSVATGVCLFEAVRQRA